MKLHTTKLTKILMALLVVAVAMIVAGFVLKSTNEMLVFIAYAGIALTVLFGVLIYKEKDKAVITRPGEIDLPMGSKIGEVERKSGRIAVLFSELASIEEENGKYTITKADGTLVNFTLDGHSAKSIEKIRAIIKTRTGK
jgi:hypothetical protein